MRLSVWHLMKAWLGVLSAAELLLMKAPEKAMAGKTADGSIKWQLCYDMTARTWWMVSLVLFFLPTYFLQYLMTKTYDQVTPPSELFAALLMRFANFSKAFGATLKNHIVFWVAEMKYMYYKCHPTFKTRTGLYLTWSCSHLSLRPLFRCLACVLFSEVCAGATRVSSGSSRLSGLHNPALGLMSEG